MVSQIIGDRICELRVQSGMTQAELAKRVHTSRSSVQAWECGANYPSIDSLILLSKIFHVSTDYLLAVSSHKTVILDSFTDRQRELVFQMMKFFDENAEQKAQKNKHHRFSRKG